MTKPKTLLDLLENIYESGRQDVRTGTYSRWSFAEAHTLITERLVEVAEVLNMTLDSFDCVCETSPEDCGSCQITRALTHLKEFIDE